MSVITCPTTCISYTQQSDQAYFATITNDSYSCGITGPVPMAIGIIFEESTDYNFVVSLASIGSSAYSFYFNLTVVGGTNANSNSAIKITNIPSGVITSLDLDNFQLPASPLVVSVELQKGLLSNDGTPFPSNTYISGDKYMITIIRCEGLYTVNNILTRPLNVSVSSNLITNPVCISCNPDNNIPKINVEAQTLINGSDIGDAVFTIYDEFPYYDLHKIPDNTCKDRKSNNIKTTIFRECCSDVRMVSVVKGKGLTLQDKINYLFAHEQTNTPYRVFNLPNVYIFYQNMILYGMAKYILARLLYGKFNINFLLGKYNDRFLNKLRNSRFCAFIEFFDLYKEYNSYFLYK
ncbi:MAG: hypothetical protein K2P99_05910 [Burkholderiales bacterium]|nr:hypothetical protein [Burkholderiales bacterium]